MAGPTLIERHPLRARLCQLLHHGRYEEHEARDGVARAGRLTLLSCDRGHLWERA